MSFRLLVMLLAATSVFCSLRNAPNLLAAESPNIILLMGDDHGWDETGYNGHPHLKTPVLDEMASQALRLDRFYSAHPTCSPTRGSVMTGRHPNRYGTFTPNWSIRPEEITIAHLLADKGYRCAHFGKWHLGPVKAESPTSPGAMGFDTWLSHDNFFELNPWLSRNGLPPEQIQGESSEILIDEALKYIKAGEGQEKPFFIVVWFGSPHEPYSGLDKDLALYDDVKNLYPGKTVRLTSNKTGRPTTRPLGEVLRERYAEITAMDRSIGTLRSELEKSGQRDNTLLWYCGDNGLPNGASITTPLRGQKAMMYEGGIRVPGIIEWPAHIKQASTSATPSVTSDMLPTLCEIVGCEVPDRPLDGASVLPLITGEEMEREVPICFWGFDVSRESKHAPYLDAQLQEGTTPLVKMMSGKYTRTFVNYHHPQVEEADYAGTRVLMDGDYKLIVRGGPSADPSQLELYNLASDPAEKKDLAKIEAKTAAKLNQKLRNWQTSVLKSLTGADY